MSVTMSGGEAAPQIIQQSPEQAHVLSTESETGRPDDSSSARPNEPRIQSGQRDDEKPSAGDIEVPQPQHHAALSQEIYSVFTTPQKRAIILTGSFISWFSPMSGSIYFPALNQIAADLGVSPAKINITVTTYLVYQPPRYSSSCPSQQR